MKRRFAAVVMGCAAAALIVPGAANAVPTGSAGSGSAQMVPIYLDILPRLAQAAVNCLIDGTPMQLCGYTGMDYDSMPVVGG
ncbi:hypothetical protein ACFWCF_01875 [Rhodococcus sp. NPDC060090]|uniref:hypothetical protein n=1 Tax=Rhodococcus sp. NPDC060090 TaxID=3347056 RepID=UPI003654E977